MPKTKLLDMPMGLHERSREVACLYHGAFWGSRKPSREIVDLIISQTAAFQTTGLVSETDELLGAVSFSIDSGSLFAWVEQLVVASDERRQGYGSRLMGHVEKLAQENGSSSVRLTATERALPFYRDLGYVMLPTDKMSKQL